MKKRTAGVKVPKEEVVKKEIGQSREGVMSQILSARYTEAVFQTRFGKW